MSKNNTWTLALADCAAHLLPAAHTSPPRHKLRLTCSVRTAVPNPIAPHRVASLPRTRALLAVHAHGHRGRLVALGARAASCHHEAAARLAEAEMAAGHHDVRDGLVRAHDAHRRRLRRLRLFRGRRRRFERGDIIMGEAQLLVERIERSGERRGGVDRLPDRCSEGSHKPSES